MKHQVFMGPEIPTVSCQNYKMEVIHLGWGISRDMGYKSIEQVSQDPTFLSQFVVSPFP